MGVCRLFFVAAAFALAAAVAVLFAVAVLARTLLAAALAVAARVLLGREVFAVQALGQLLVGGVAHALHPAAEMQGLAGHRMVEIHRHGALGDLADGALEHLSGLVEHRDGAALDEQVLADLAVDGECRPGEVDQVGRIVGAVAVLGAQHEVERGARLQVLQRRLKLGQQHPGTMYILQGSLGPRLVGNPPLNLQSPLYYKHHINWQYEYK